MAFLFFLFGVPPDNVAVNRRLELYVFTSADCVPCKQFKKDYAENKNGLQRYINTYFAKNKDKYYFEVVWKEDWSNKEIVIEYEKVTGRSLSGVPLFWVRGRSWSLGGYSQPRDVLEYLSKGNKR